MQNGKTTPGKGQRVPFRQSLGKTTYSLQPLLPAVYISALRLAPRSSAIESQPAALGTEPSGVRSARGAVINWPGRLLKFGVLASRFQSPERDRGGGDMRLLRIVGKSASSHTKAAAAADPLPDAKDDPDGAGAVTVVAAGADRNNGSVNGSKDELFFEARPWLDSDSEDDFYSVRGDFTPSRGSTPDHPRLICGRILVDRSGPSLVQKKQRLIELLQEKQHYDDEDDSVTDVSSDLEHSAVHAEEHMKASRKTEKSKKSSRSGCFPTLVWKRSFTSCRKKKKEKEQKDKVN